MEQKQQNDPVGRTYDISVEELMQLLPHRYPMLMIDRIDGAVLGHSATGVKSVSINEWFFAGHFPEHPVMPGVLIVEAMAQTSAALVMKTLQVQEGGVPTLVYFMSIDDARFRKPVVPGDTLRLKVECQRKRGGVWKFKGVGYVEDTIVAESVYTAMITEKNEKPRV